MKDIVYDLIETKLKIKELETKLTALELVNVELTNDNKDLTNEVNTWKTQVTAYINDYRDMYKKEEDVTNDNVKTEEVNIIENVNIENDTKTETVNTVDTNEENKKTRSEYMKEYMRNKRNKQKEEKKRLIVNKT